MEEKREYQQGDTLCFDLTLIGKSIDYLPYFIYTFDELGRMGIGKGRGKYQLEEVRATPTGERLKVRGQRGDTISGDERSKDKGEGYEKIYSGKIKSFIGVIGLLNLKILNSFNFHPPP